MNTISPHCITMFNLDLWILHHLGIPVESFVYAFNESIKFFLRIVIPFGIFIAVSLPRRPVASPALDTFYVKLRTPVTGDAENDAIRLQAGIDNPSQTRNEKLFPHSEWEILRLSKTGYIGFLVTCAITALLLVIATILM